MKHAFNKLHNLDYNKIIILVVFFLPMTFNGDILFKMPPLSPNNLSSLQMQGMDRKYDGHIWSKAITSNIKNNFGFNIKKVCYLGHLCYVKMDCNCLVHSRA